MPASSSCVFPPPVSGEDHPVKRRAGSQRRRRDAREVRRASQPRDTAGAEAGEEHKPGPRFGVWGIKGVTCVDGSEAGTIPGAPAGPQAEIAQCSQGRAGGWECVHRLGGEGQDGGGTRSCGSPEVVLAPAWEGGLLKRSL